MALTPNGFLFTWGLNVHGQLGLGNFKDKSMPVPVLYLQQEKITQISAGFMHSGAVTETGKLYMWGDNHDCRIFQPVQQYSKNMRIRNFAIPQYCDYLEGIKVQQVSCGSTHTLVLTTFGEVFSAGSNEFGQLGVKDYKILSKMHQMQLETGNV